MKDTRALGIDPDRLQRLIALAVEEDLGTRGDITTQTAVQAWADPLCLARADLVVRSETVLAGLEVIPAVLQAYDAVLAFEPAAEDGGRLAAGSRAGTIAGRLAALLSAERVVLNFVQRLSGVATLTRRFVDRVAGTPALIYDTRKTTPGWRDLEKYAVRCGGGHNHRRGLYDAILVKDNHWAGGAAAGGSGRFAGRAFELLNVASALQPAPDFVEMEVDNLSQFEQLLDVVGIDVILLDNFTVSDIRRAVELRDARNLRGKLTLEVSGGVTLDSVAAIAQAGPDRISVGALTHSAPAADIGLDLSC